MPAYRQHRALFVERGIADALYAEQLAATLPDNGWHPREAVSLYRELLAGVRGEKAVICAIGTHTALAALLASGPDKHSALTGPELIQQSVRELVTMAKGDRPHGQDSFNWRMDLRSAADVLERWPTPITISPAGTHVQTGAHFVSVAPREHPVRHAYVAFLRGEGRNRSSWDQIAVLYAVRGTGGPFALGVEGGVMLDVSTGQHVWADKSGSGFPRRLVLPTCSDAALAEEIEHWMIDSLTISQSGIG